jgi:hypothetical protein
MLKAETFAHSNKSQKLHYSVSFVNNLFTYTYMAFLHKNLWFLLALFANFEVKFGRDGSKFLRPSTAWENQVVKIVVPYFMCIIK